MPIARLFRKNRSWRNNKLARDPEFFHRLSQSQAPEYLWIGCSDSRVPATDVIGLEPGELFVHRNVANLVVDSDMNLLSVLQFAVDGLGVREVIVTGHYGCGGVKAALGRSNLGLVDNWLVPIKQIHQQHREELDAITDIDARANRLSELNVVQQVKNLASTTIVQDAWARGQRLGLHGWVYSLEEGLLESVGCTMTSPDQLEPALRLRPLS
jgi:carbonic anhydrase